MKTKIIKKYPWQVILYVLSLIVSLVVPYAISLLIDNIILANNFSNLLGWFFPVLAIAIVSSVLTFYFIHFTIIKAIVNSSMKLSINAVKKMLRIPVIEYSKKEKSYYLNVVTNSAFTYGNVHASVYLQLIASAICVLVVLGVVLYINPILCAVFVLYIPIVIFSTQSQTGKLARMQSDAVVKQDKFLSSLRNIIDHKREINALHETEFFIGRYSKYMSTWKKFIMKYHFLNVLTGNLPSFLAKIYGIIYLLVGTYLVSTNDITPGILVMGFQYLQLISEPINSVAQVYIQLKANKEHIKRVDVLDMEKELNEDYESMKTIKDDYIIKADDFKIYLDEEEKHLLFGIDSLDIPSVGLFLIKGKNGTGKSMLLNLILGFINTKWITGSFSINSDIYNTGYLTYPLFFINGTFDENIFCRDYDKKLLEILNIDFNGKDIVNNPVNLSLGQQQKIGLLRVLSTPKPFMFLDEPNSNLDKETQASLKDYIEELKSNRGIVVITHDNSLDDIADGIYEIKDNKLIKH